MILPNTIDLNTLEAEIYRYCCTVGREIFQKILTQIDEKLMLERNREQYRHKGKRRTTLKTIMGEVEYERVLYEFVNENGETGRVYLLDQELGFERVGFISSLLAGKIAETSCELSYRKTAQTVGKLTGQSISHTGAWDVVQALGAKIDTQERQAAVRAKNNKGTGTLETKLLFEEQDGTHITLQGKDRKNLGKSAEMKIAIAYTGAKKTGKKRYNLTDKVACADFEGINKFYDRKEGVIAETYNVDEIELRVLNADGAGWPKRSIVDDTIYQLDTFHRNQAVLRYVSDPEARKLIFKLLYSKKIDLLLEVIEAYSNSTDDEKTRDNFLQLLKYFQNNKDGLISYKRRGIDLPEPPGDMVYRGCGAMESNVFSIIGHRMKNNRTAWSIKGGNNLAKLLTLKATGKLSEALSKLASNILTERFSEEVQTVLSATQAPKREGKGYNGFSHATIPPSQKWMKDLFALKPIH
jgi:hypothetical protein